MTEYGRGPAPGQWRPEEDPLYGDRSWDPYASQDTGYQQPYHPDGAVQGGQYGDPYGQQHYPQQQYPEQQYADPYATGQLPSYDVAGQDPYAAGYGGGDPYGAGDGPAGPYGMQQHPDPYGTGEQPPVPGGYDAPYGSGQAAYPAGGEPQPQDPQQPAGAQQPQARGGRPQPGPDPETGWDPGPDQGEHDFFTRTDDDWDDEDEDEGRGRSGRRGGRDKRGGGKRRSGMACLVVVVLLGGGLGTVGYFGYDFYQSHFAAAPDYGGDGSGSVEVEVPEGSTLAEMAAALEKAGVIKSRGAFTEAAAENQKALGIHAGIYTLHKKMSAASAIKLMLDPNSQSGLVVPEGKRAKQIYALIDKALGKPEGTTAKAAKDGGLGLPAWADGNPEGLLFPARYPVGTKSDPSDVLKKMVQRAESEYEKLHLEAKANKVGKSPEQIIIIASLVQAEAQEDGDFGKVSRVIYNRLDQNMALGFDSTINYAKGESKLNTSIADTKIDSPYNTYRHKGLPPGPIDSPGLKAIDAALNPTKGDWLYFVTVKPGDTRFTDSAAEHQRNVEDFNREQAEKKENGG
jgi:UPF0755 protein